MRRALALTAIVVLLCSCGPPEFAQFIILNKTDETINVYRMDDDQAVVGPLPPGRQTDLLPENSADCFEGTLVARTLAGREVARRVEPLCRHDRWVITEVAPSDGSPQP
jgi:hypothetical protein